VQGPAQGLCPQPRVVASRSAGSSGRGQQHPVRELDVVATVQAGARCHARPEAKVQQVRTGARSHARPETKALLDVVGARDHTRPVQQARGRAAADRRLLGASRELAARPVEEELQG